MRHRARHRAGAGSGNEMKGERGDLMYSGTRFFIATGLTMLACLAPAARGGHAQGLPNVIEGFFPNQLAAGQSNVLHLGIPGRNEISGIEITPSAGVAVKNIVRGDTRGGSTVWEGTRDVAADAAPGNRTIVATGPMTRTAQRAIGVCGYVTKVSEVRVVAAQVNQRAVPFQFAMNETPNELGA